MYNMYMEDRSYSTEGVILARRNQGEADRLLTIFTKHYGRVRVVAKGVRRTTSRKKGSLELFNYVRFFAARGRNMDIITEVETKNSFLDWRGDLTKVAVAYHLCEIVNRLTAEKQENRELFEELVLALEGLGKLDYWAIYSFVQTFKVRILEELGFVERGRPIPGNLDAYIEHLINGNLKTRKFLLQLSQ